MTSHRHVIVIRSAWYHHGDLRMIDDYFACAICGQEYHPDLGEIAPHWYLNEPHDSSLKHLELIKAIEAVSAANLLARNPLSAGKE